MHLQFSYKSCIKNENMKQVQENSESVLPLLSDTLCHQYAVLHVSAFILQQS